MKKNTFKSSIDLAFKQHKNLYIISFILVISGIATGCILAITRSDNVDITVKQYFENFMTALTLQGISKSEVFRLSFFNSLNAFAIISISGLFLWLLPLGGIQLFMNGFKLGFTLLYFVKLFHLKGFIIALFFLLPQIILFIPATCYLYINKIIVINKRNFFRKVGFSYTTKTEFFKSFLVSFLIYWLITLFSCIVDGYLIPPIIKLFSIFFI